MGHSLKYKLIPRLLILIISMGCANSTTKQTQSTKVKISGEMKNVMRLGKLEGNISLDTLSQKNLYGIGPVEYLKGELMIFDGISYVSKVETDSTMTIETSFEVKAPF